MANRLYYHATTEKAFHSILNDQVIKKGIDGVVYLCDTKEDAAKFLLIRQIKPIYIFEIKLKESEVVESFDHSQRFFQCRAWYVERDIMYKEITNVYVIGQAE